MLVMVVVVAVLLYFTLCTYLLKVVGSVIMMMMMVGGGGGGGGSERTREWAKHFLVTHFFFSNVVQSTLLLALALTRLFNHSLLLLGWIAYLLFLLLCAESWLWLVFGFFYNAPAIFTIYQPAYFTMLPEYSTKIFCVAAREACIKFLMLCDLRTLYFRYLHNDKEESSKFMKMRWDK